MKTEEEYKDVMRRRRLVRSEALNWRPFGKPRPDPGHSSILGEPCPDIPTHDCVLSRRGAAASPTTAQPGAKNTVRLWLGSEV